MIQVPDEIQQEIFNDYKNMWLDKLFYGLTCWYRDIGFEEQKETFFALVKEFLDKGLIKFETPPIEGLFAGDGVIWQEEHDKIVQYLIDGFPKEATDEKDAEVNLYFFLVAPAVLWQQEDGRYM